MAEPLRDAHFCPHCATPLIPTPMERAVYPGCPQCGFIVFPDPKVAAAAVIEQAGSLLLVQRARHPIGLWCLPAGYVNADEAPATAAIREVAEETGLIAVASRLVDVYSDTRAGVILIVYEAKLVGGVIQPDPQEVQAVRFFSPGAVPPEEALAFVTGRAAIAAWQRARGGE